jgi:glycerol transport system ATP-binding protein
MATIELKNITHLYKSDVRRKKGTPETLAVENINITWEDGSKNALLGPSGCGKTTILNIISGLLTPTEGQVLIDGKDVTHLPPKERKIGQVFQFPIVYESMNVFENLAFPLRNKKIAESEIRSRVNKIAEVLELTSILELKTNALSPDERHRVSLGRSHIRMDLNGILYDEPLTDVDPRQKWRLRRKIVEEQRLTKLTAVYVTHDQDEALTFAESTTIIKDGKIVQTGTTEDLYYTPVSPFVGFFIGSPGMNVLECRLTDKGFDFGDFEYPISSRVKKYLNRNGKSFHLGIRPEFIKISAKKIPGAIAFKIINLEDLGAYEIITLEKGKTRLYSRLPEEEEIFKPIGSEVWVTFPEETMNIYKNEKRIDISNI